MYVPCRQEMCVICTTVLLGSARISEEDPGLEPRDDVVMHKGVIGSTSAQNGGMSMMTHTN